MMGGILTTYKLNEGVGRETRLDGPRYFFILIHSMYNLTFFHLILATMLVMTTNNVWRKQTDTLLGCPTSSRATPGSTSMHDLYQGRDQLSKIIYETDVDYRHLV